MGNYFSSETRGSIMGEYCKACCGIALLVNVNTIVTIIMQLLVFVFTGVWAANSSVGNLLGTAIAGLGLHFWSGEFSWQIVMLFCGALLVVQAVIVGACLVTVPPAVSGDFSDSAVNSGSSAAPVQSKDDEDDGESVEASLFQSSHQRQRVGHRDRRITIITAWCVPGVAVYAFAYALIKAVSHAACFRSFVAFVV
jgi:hypothetical protein